VAKCTSLLAGFQMGAEKVDADLRLRRIQVMRALRAEGESPGAHAFFEFADIIDDLLGKIESLELARLYLRKAMRLVQGAA
jgi:hypothetical protein